VAIFARPWGNRGALIADATTDRPERLAQLGTAFVLGPDPEAQPQRVEIESVQFHKQRVIVKLRGVDSISQAEALRGAELCVPIAERPKAPEGEYYIADLFGCEVIERITGRRLGIVSGWLETGGAPLLEVSVPQGGEPLLVPFARSICVEIAPEQRRIVVELPEGLEELNQP
jgi:16S rRNA processing protein RimM